MGIVRVVPERKPALAISGAESTQTGWLHVVVGRQPRLSLILLPANESRQHYLLRGPAMMRGQVGGLNLV